MNDTAKGRNQVARGRAVALGGALVTALALAGCGGADIGEPGVEEAASRYEGIAEQGSSLGDPQAPLTLTEFADLQCPFCRDAALVAVRPVVERYVRSGQVRIVYRNLAFLGTDSVKAARMAAAAALQNRLFPFLDVFFRNQGRENSGYVTDAFLFTVASSVPGLNVSRALIDRSSPAVTAQLEEARSEAARLGVSGTPTFFLSRTGEEPVRIHLKSITPATLTAPIEHALDELGAPR